MLDLLRLTLPDPLFAQGIVAILTRLGRGLVADFAVVALAATLDVTVDSESSTQPAVQRVVLDPFSRGPAVPTTKKKPQDDSVCFCFRKDSELSHVAAHPIIPNTNRSMLRYHV